MAHAAQRLNSEIRLFLGEMFRRYSRGYHTLPIQVSVFENPMIGMDVLNGYRRCGRLVLRPEGTPNNMCVLLITSHRESDLLMNTKLNTNSQMLSVEPHLLVSPSALNFYTDQIEKVILELCFAYQAPPAVPLSTESLGELVHRMRELGECTLTFAKEKENEFWYVMKGPPDQRVCIGSGLLPETALQKAFQAT